MKYLRIPKSPLGQKLDEAANLQQHATELLGQLETRYAGKPLDEKAGGWRHDPKGWQQRHRPK